MRFFNWLRKPLAEEPVPNFDSLCEFTGHPSDFYFKYNPLIYWLASEKIQPSHGKPRMGIYLVNRQTTEVVRLVATETHNGWNMLSEELDIYTGKRVLLERRFLTLEGALDTWFAAENRGVHLTLKTMERVVAQIIREEADVPVATPPTSQSKSGV